ncbi:MAG: 4Fe-4S dicluster domain-containing protein [Candidatus Lokiarchaeota archaeon]|nr:4Fe-4S dicluster domain-containing protein [Candidatus Lokiarchaeota archaeon]MBD3201759.1 4Fe-4S dicluster domain-containing protein [Candidatus Lokiarchaeota archaeon]
MVSVDYELKKQVMDAHIKDTLKYCYQCARCTDVCPVAKVTNQRYNPRPVILNSFLGFKNAILGQEDNFNLWGCTVCDTCDEICPQNIELTEIFTVLKNMSIRRGEGPDYYTSQASMVYESGKAIPMQSAIERRRKDLGLPMIEPPVIEEVQKILNKTQLNEILQNNKEE